MSMGDPSKGYHHPTPHGHYSYPRPEEQNRGPPPMLPPMASLLPRHEQMEREHHRQPYPSPTFHTHQNEARHPLWLSEQNPHAPVQHIFHPPQPLSSHGQQYQGEQHLVSTHNHSSIAVPVSHGAPLAPRRQSKKIVQRRFDHPKDQEERRPSTSMTARYGEREAGTEPTTEAYLQQEGMRFEPSWGTPQISRSMPISGLLSGQPSSEQLRTPEPKFSIRMRQEPMAARACGFGERDRRVIDPPPILQLDVESPNSSPEELSALIRQPYAVVHCTLWDPVADRDDTAMPGTTDKRQQRRLMGTLVASPFVGLDEHDVEGCFFTFPDLSVRTPGTYSLKFSLAILDPTRMRPGNSVPVTSTVKSAAFNVFNAKDFGGMRASTALTKRLKHQGCLISVKKGNANARGGSVHARDDDEDDDDGDDDLDDGDDNDDSRLSAVKKGKRAKR